MRKELEIGDEIVIYPEKGYYYTSLETKNGFEYQEFKSSNFPETLTAVFIGREKGKNGKWYEKYTLKTIPEELKDFRLRGKPGFTNSIKETNKISEILQGIAEDGRKILYPRSINIEDVNEILGVVVDFKNRVVYQKNNPSENISSSDTFGQRSILHLEPEIYSSIDSEFIEEKEVKSTAYSYRIDNLEETNKRKEIVLINAEYHLASDFVYVNSRDVIFSSGMVYTITGFTYAGAIALFDFYGISYFNYAAVRPVFYLEADKEQQETAELLEEIKKQQEKITEIKKDISNLEENLKKEEKKLGKMLEKAQNLYRK